MRPKIYIDGKEGTTGLQIYERLGARDDLELLLIDEEKRKDTEERRKFLNAADIVFLCLPDAAAREAVSLIENDHTRVIDASTAHRTADGWAYGFPELSDDHRAAIQTSTRVANPGCHATGFIASVYPLVAHGVLSATDALTCFSLTGYSGGGKKMIASYEAEDKTNDLYARVYGLNLQHKHLPEMQKVCGLATPPVFCPVVDDYYKGMATTVMLPDHNVHIVWQALSAHYDRSEDGQGRASRRGRTHDLGQHLLWPRQSDPVRARSPLADHRYRTVRQPRQGCVGCRRSKYESHARSGRDHRAYPCKEAFPSCMKSSRAA